MTPRARRAVARTIQTNEAMAVAAENSPRLVIEHVRPCVDGGRYPIKRVVGDAVEVEATTYKDGHDLLRARIRYVRPGGTEWAVAPMEYEKNLDRVAGAFTVDAIGTWRYRVEGWTDRFGTWRSDLLKKVQAEQDTHSDLLEGAELIAEAAAASKGASKSALQSAAALLREEDRSDRDRAHVALDPGLLELMDAHLPPADLARSDELAVAVEPKDAAFAAWYELFPRSQGDVPGQHGTFDDAAERLPELAALGFDVVYLPPIHPIGRAHRKGPNNTLNAGPGDPGSPWAIGNENGGHMAIEPELGTIEDFRRFVKRANELGLEVALDYALQCAPDHPWVKEHPEWFHVRPDGSIKYAENPPKKYQDIYPLNFWGDNAQGLWDACRDIFLYWLAQGVRIFRVDNPHTKPFAFWEWCLAEVKAKHPEAVFLSEAFTRPARMKGLAKLGFSQSYTYFTWRNEAWELREYLEELAQTDMAEYFRPNFFANTPDILHEYLQTGGRPAFRIRLVLAGTLAPLYGIYSGYELGENVPVKQGSEEYMNSEKYEIRVRDYDAEGNINEDIRTLNRIRREHAALQRLDNITFHPTENETILFYHKTAPDDDLLIAVNLDPHRVQETMVHVPLAELGIGEHEPFDVDDLLSGARYTWQGTRNYVRLDPAAQVAHVLKIRRRGT